MKNKNYRSIIIGFMFIICCLILSAGCETKSNVVLARVGNAKLTKAELMAQLPQDFTVTRENLPVFLDKWISSELLYQEAVRSGLDKDEKIKLQTQQLAKEFIVNAFLEQEAAKIKVPPSALLAYFNQHKEDFLSEVKIRRIILPSYERAERTLEELKQGADFVQLAKERSIEQTQDKGEPSRFFARGITGIEPSLEEAIFALKPGQISDVLRTSEGYQIIKLEEKRKVKKDVTFTDVANYIQDILSYQQNRDHIDSIINALRAKGKFQTFPDAYFSTRK